MKSHTGGKMYLSKGSVYPTPARHKLNTRNSKEFELVRVDYVMPVILWSKYFLESQGYNIYAGIFQDNHSAMLLQKNGRGSSGNRNIHINIRYFFVVDIVKSGGIKVKYFQ